MAAFNPLTTQSKWTINLLKTSEALTADKLRLYLATVFSVDKQHVEIDSPTQLTLTLAYLAKRATLEAKTGKLFTNKFISFHPINLTLTKEERQVAGSVTEFLNGLPSDSEEDDEEEADHPPPSKKSKRKRTRR